MKDNIIVTIARQYGSGGHEVGEIVAKEHNLVFHDKSLIELAAQKSGIDMELLKKADEDVTPSFLYSIAVGNYSVYPLSINMSPYEMPINDKLFNLQADIIKEEAEKAPSVFVGRCADYILNNNKNVIRLFLKNTFITPMNSLLLHLIPLFFSSSIFSPHKYYEEFIIILYHL